MIPDLQRFGRFGRLTIRLAGIDIEIQAIFVAWLLLLGFVVERSVGALLIWVVVGGGAVLLHELGHAFAYRAFGVQPRIVLSALFGVTYGAELPPGRSIVVSLAGPATGLAIGLPALALWAALPSSDGLLAIALSDLVLVGLGWAIINLLPILPLDGGQAVRAALAATAWPHAETAALVVSLATAVVVAIAGLIGGYLLVTLFVAWFAFGSWQDLLELRGSPVRERLSRHGRELMAGDTEAAIAGFSALEQSARSKTETADAVTALAFALLADGRAEEAIDAFARHPRPATQPLLQSAVELHHGSLDARFAAQLAERHDALAAMGAMRAVVDTGHLDDVAWQADGLGPRPSSRALLMMLVGLHLDGLHEEAVSIGERLAERQPSWHEVAYFVASSHGALGQSDEALRWLQRAAELGAGYETYIERDRNLSDARGLPAYPSIRERIGANRARRPGSADLLGTAATDAGEPA